MSLTRSHGDLELLVSLWSMETHTFITSHGEFTPTQEDVLVMFCLLLFVDNDATSIVLSKEEDGRLQLLNVTVRISNKSTYTSSISYFQEGEGQGKRVTVEALLSY